MCELISASATQIFCSFWKPLNFSATSSLKEAKDLINYEVSQDL